MRLLIGTDEDPGHRRQLDVSAAEWTAAMACIQAAKQGMHFKLEVNDKLTDSVVYVADADCGLGCRCALRELEDYEK